MPERISVFALVCFGGVAVVPLDVATYASASFVCCHAQKACSKDKAEECPSGPNCGVIRGRSFHDSLARGRGMMARTNDAGRCTCWHHTFRTPHRTPRHTRWAGCRLWLLPCHRQRASIIRATSLCLPAMHRCGRCNAPLGGLSSYPQTQP